MSPRLRRTAPAPMRGPFVRPYLRHMTTNRPQLRLLGGASPRSSRVSPRSLRASLAGDLPGRLRALGQRPLTAPTRAPREPASGGPRQGLSAGPGVSTDVFPTRDPRPEPAVGPSAAALTLRRWRDPLRPRPVRGVFLAGGPTPEPLVFSPRLSSSLGRPESFKRGLAGSLLSSFSAKVLVPFSMTLNPTPAVFKSFWFVLFLLCGKERVRKERPCWKPRLVGEAPGQAGV